MKRKLILLVLAVALTTLFAFTVAGCNSIISVEDVTFSSISENPIEYEVGAFNYDDYTVTATYSDGTVDVIKLSPDMISNYDQMQLSVLGLHTITVTYENRSFTFDVIIIAKDATKDESKPHLDSEKFVYDGTTHTIAVKGDIPLGATIYYPQGQSFKNAGIYEVSAIIYADNYETLTLNATIEIERATYDMSDVYLDVDYGEEYVVLTDAELDKKNAQFYDGPRWAKTIDEKYIPYDVSIDYTDDEEYDGHLYKTVKRTAFTYDGQDHSAIVKGKIPEGLTYEYYITTVFNKVETLQEGNSARNAGTYYVYAVFSGDATNYNTNNLSIWTEMVINKQAISNEVLKSIVFGEKEGVTEDGETYRYSEYTYNGTPRRITIDALNLPEGMNVVYLDENGETFGTRTDAGVYHITARFVLNSERNYELANDLHATLIINPASYYIENISFGLENGSLVTKYNAQSQVPTAKNVPTGLEFAYYTLNDTVVDTLVDAGEYNLVAHFTNNNKNFKDIDPISFKFTIDKINFGQVSSELVVNKTTSDGSIASMGKNDDLPYGDKYSIEYIEYILPVGVTRTISYVDLDGTTYDGLPIDKTEVGEYNAIVKYFYNMDNYYDAYVVNDLTYKMSIIRRVFDALTRVELSRIDVKFQEKLDHYTTCSYNENLIPDWVELDKLFVFNSNNTIVSTAINADEYQYQYRFKYFDGVELKYAYTQKQVLKVEGIRFTIRDDDHPDGKYTVTYVEKKEYDGLSCIPTIDISYFDSSLNPKKEWVSYLYQEPGSSEYITVDKADYTKYSKKAGKHQFKYKVWATNYEPESETINITVTQKAIDVDMAMWSTSNTVLYFDNKDHSNNIVKVTNDTTYEYQNLITVKPKLLNKEDYSGARNGTDVGKYYYTIEFGTTDSNYYARVENNSLFNYSVQIDQLEACSTTTGLDSPFYPFDVKVYSWLSDAYVTPTHNLSFTNINETDEIYEYLKNYLSLNNINGKYVLTANEYNFEYNGFNFKFALDDAVFDKTNDYQKAVYTILSEARFSMYRVAKSGRTIVVAQNVTYQSIYSQLTNALNEGKYSGVATYYIVINFSDNVSINSDSNLIYKIDTDYYKINNFADPLRKWSDDDTMTISGTSVTFNATTEDISTAFNNITSYNGATMLNYDVYYDHSVINFDLSRDMHKILKDIFESTTIIEVYKSNGFKVTSSIFDNTDLKSDNGNFTEVGTYYFFVEMGYNILYNESSMVVVKINVKPVNIDFSSAFDVYAGTTKITTHKVTRNYLTSADSSINQDDVESYYSDYSGYNVYEYTNEYEYTTGAYAYKLNVNILNAIQAVVGTDLIDKYGFTITSRYYSLKSGTIIDIDNVTAATEKTYKTTDGLQSVISLAENAGYYYFYIDTGDKNITIGGDQRLVFCLNIEASTKYTYTINGKAYNLTETLPDCEIKWIGSKSYTWVWPETDKSYTDYHIASITDSNKQFKVTNVDTSKIGIINSTFDGLTPTLNNIKVCFDTEKYGGIEKYVTANIVLTKNTINLHDFYYSFIANMGVKDYPESYTFNGESYSNTVRNYLYTNDSYGLKYWLGNQLVVKDEEGVVIDKIDNYVLAQIYADMFDITTCTYDSTNDKFENISTGVYGGEYRVFIKPKYDTYVNNYLNCYDICYDYYDGTDIMDGVRYFDATTMKDLGSNFASFNYNCYYKLVIAKLALVMNDTINHNMLQYTFDGTDHAYTDIYDLILELGNSDNPKPSSLEYAANYIAPFLNFGNGLSTNIDVEDNRSMSYKEVIIRSLFENLNYKTYNDSNPTSTDSVVEAGDYFLFFNYNIIPDKYKDCIYFAVKSVLDGDQDGSLTTLSSGGIIFVPIKVDKLTINFESIEDAGTLYGTAGEDKFMDVVNRGLGDFNKLYALKSAYEASTHEYFISCSNTIYASTSMVKYSSIRETNRSQNIDHDISKVLKEGYAYKSTFTFNVTLDYYKNIQFVDSSGNAISMDSEKTVNIIVLSNVSVEKVDEPNLSFNTNYVTFNHLYDQTQHVYTKMPATTYYDVKHERNERNNVMLVTINHATIGSYSSSNPLYYFNMYAENSYYARFCGIMSGNGNIVEYSPNSSSSDYTYSINMNYVDMLKVYLIYELDGYLKTNNGNYKYIAVAYWFYKI